MTFSNLIPWKSKEKSLAPRSGTADPFRQFQHEMDRLFEEFRGFGLAQMAESEGGVGWAPAVNMTEDEKEIRVTAELPGMDEKDIEVDFSHNTLTIRGEKKEEEKEESQNFYRMERRYGSFQRQIDVPREVEADKVEAEFKKGVLTVHLPKTKEARTNARKIQVKS
jgi:HSP20 family protein